MTTLVWAGAVIAVLLWVVAVAAIVWGVAEIIDNLGRLVGDGEDPEADDKAWVKILGWILTAIGGVLIAAWVIREVSKGRKK